MIARERHRAIAILHHRTAPLMMPASLKILARWNASAALLTMLLVGNVPALPPSPICNVPPLMVVVRL